MYISRMTPTKPIARGYARHATDEKRLRDAGVKTIYRADKGETVGKFRMRAGELLGVVDGLRAFGDNRGPINEAVKLVKASGAAIIDVETGLRSDVDGVEMLHKALSSQTMTPEFAAAMQKKAVEARLEGAISEAKAKRIWFDGRWSVKQKVEMCGRGWSRRRLYDTFGKTNAPAGRRGK